MNSIEFCYWLQGYLELRDEDKLLTARQIKIVKDHLALVFDKVTPDRPVKLEEEEPDVWPSVRIDPFDRPDVFCSPVTVAPPVVQPTVVPNKTDIEEIVKKIQRNHEEDQKSIRVTCAPEAPKRGVDYWAGRPGLNPGRPGTGRLC